MIVHTSVKVGIAGFLKSLGRCTATEGFLLSMAFSWLCKPARFGDSPGSVSVSIGWCEDSVARVDLLSPRDGLVVTFPDVLDLRWRLGISWVIRVKA